jgi:hypothetical protein
MQAVDGPSIVSRLNSFAANYRGMEEGDESGSEAHVDMDESSREVPADSAAKVPLLQRVTFRAPPLAHAPRARGWVAPACHRKLPSIEMTRLHH